MKKPLIAKNPTMYNLYKDLQQVEKHLMEICSIAEPLAPEEITLYLDVVITLLKRHVVDNCKSEYMSRVKNGQEPFIPDGMSLAKILVGCNEFVERAISYFAESEIPNPTMQDDFKIAKQYLMEIVGWYASLDNKNETKRDLRHFERIAQYQVEFPFTDDQRGLCPDPDLPDSYRRVIEQLPFMVQAYNPPKEFLDKTQAFHDIAENFIRWYSSGYYVIPMKDDFVSDTSEQINQNESN